MNEEAKAFLKEKLNSGLGHDDLRREMISNGYGTQGFEEEYAALAKELGIKEPPKPAPKFPTTDLTGSAIPEGEVAMPSVLELLKLSFRRVFAHFGAIIWSSIIMIAMTAVLVFIPTTPTPLLFGPMFVVVNILSVVLTVFVAIVSLMALFYTIVLSDSGSSYFFGLQWAYVKFFSLVSLSVIVAALLLTGFTFLVVPGLAFLVYSLFTFVVLAKEDKSGVGAILRSVDLVRGSFWTITFRMITVMVIVGVISAVTTLLLSGLSDVMYGIEYGQLLVIALAILVEMTLSALMFAAVGIMYRSRSSAKPFFELSAYKYVNWLFTLVVLVVIVFAATVTWLGSSNYNGYFDQWIDLEADYDQVKYPSIDNDGGENFDDVILRRRADEAFVSGNYYAGRMGTADGICGDIVLEDKVQCRDGDSGFMILVPLSNETLYCRDGQGFKGDVTDWPSGLTCQ